MTEPTEPGREPVPEPTIQPDREPASQPDAADVPATDVLAADLPSTARPPADDAPAPAGSPTAGEVDEIPVPDSSVGSATPTPAGAAPAAGPGGRRPAAILAYLGVALLGIAIGAGAFAVATGRTGTASPSPSPSAAPSEAPAGNTTGRADAPVTIEVWADYQCPYCRLEDLLFGGGLEREYVTPGIVRIVYRDFAFLGQESIDAAVAARCAGAQEAAALLRYHDALYTFQQGENQGRFARQNLLQVAQIAGVPDTKAFEACLDDPAIAKAVADETTAGRDAGIESTPTMRLRGPGGERVLTGFSQTWPPLRDAIEAVRMAPASASPGASAAPSSGASAAPSTASPSPGASAPPTGSPSPTASPVPTASPAPTASGSPPATASPAPTTLPSPSATPAP